MQESNYVKGMFRDFTLCDELNNGWHYYKFSNDLILGVRLNLTKTFFVVDGENKKQFSNNTLPILEFEHNIESVVLTTNEYMKISSSGV